MKPTVLVLNLDGSVDIKKLNSFLQENLIDYELVVACNPNYVSINNKKVVECVFDQNTKPDEAINTLIPNCGGEALVVVRKIENNNFKPMLEVLKNLKENDQVVVIKKKSNAIKDFFKKILAFAVRFLYGYKFYDSNLSVIAFGEVPFNVLKQTENSSTYTKIDKWAGIKVVEVEGDCPKVKLSEHKWTRFVRLGAYFTVILAIILLWNLVPSLFEASLMKIAGVSFVIFMALLSIIDITIILVAHLVGGNTFKNASILKIHNFEEKQEDEPKKKTTKKKSQKNTNKKTKKLKESKDE